MLSERLDRGIDWAPGAMIALASGAIYLALRPPLYDFDGYMYRLYALLPSRSSNANPQHLLWNSVQILLATLAERLGHPSTVPVQLFGILINCATLFLLYRLLLRASSSVATAAAGTLFVALSPSFWYLGLQNHPYPLTFLALVCFLSIWPPRAQTPAGMQLAAAGLYVVVATLFHQAVILLLPGATITLVLFGQGTLWRKLGVSLLWSAGVTLLVAIAYAAFWQLVLVTPGQTISLFSWVTEYMNDVHPIQLFEVGIWKTTARSLMGLSGSILQDYRLRWFMEEIFRPATVHAIYALAALGAAFLLTGFLLRSHARKALRELIRTNCLFTVSLLSLVSWWTFAFAWEPATPHYWTLGLFPALVCAATALPRLGNSRGIITATVLLSAWNCYFNHAFDQLNAAHFSDAMLESVEQHVGSHDVFIVLSDDQWFANVNYILLFRVLQYVAPGRGVAIFNDLVFAPGGAQSWREKLGARIDSTIRSGGRAYVAAHVLDPHSYQDLSGAGYPFNEQINRAYLTLDGALYHQQIEDFFAQYELRSCDFAIGRDHYLSVGRRRKWR